MTNNSEELHPQNVTNNIQSLEGLQILVVDDNPDSLFLTTCILESYGVQVLTATSALEALEAIEQSKFDLLIFDIAMPDMDGYSLIRKVRKNLLTENTNVPAIALTALSLEESSNMALISGFQGYVNKPIDPNVLIIEILKILGSSASQNGNS
ncbi:response regulator [Nostoc sp. TCL26-01]|uniref:response regulator n=1 Tax=Nostoc sp. TCL26-01 TaxID=2576904 RepID=UPI0015BFEDC1|nr:response regulator [Nostoc sp. TCL26-01]QLE57779.1 response regulator [Nostoc sp. TCL26-01]